MGKRHVATFQTWLCEVEGLVKKTAALRLKLELHFWRLGRGYGAIRGQREKFLLAEHRETEMGKANVWTQKVKRINGSILAFNSRLFPDVTFA